MPDTKNLSSINRFGDPVKQKIGLLRYGDMHALGRGGNSFGFWGGGGYNVPMIASGAFAVGYAWIENLCEKQYGKYVLPLWLE